MTEWATFHGSASEEQDQIKLTGAGDHGVILVPTEGVSFVHNKISVRIGMVATIVEKPQQSGRIASFAGGDGCGETCSVGLIEICVSDGRVLGPCRMMAQT